MYLLCKLNMPIIIFIESIESNYISFTFPLFLNFKDAYNMFLIVLIKHEYTLYIITMHH